MFSNVKVLDLSKYHHVIVCTGAGVSTGCGITPYRTPGGMLDQIHAKWDKKYPELQGTDGTLALSRSFHNNHPEFSTEFNTWFKSQFTNIKPGPVHKMCAILEQQNKLVRVYTQNVDGLHDHISLVPCLKEKVVNFHGSVDKIVLYGDPIPEHVYTHVREDFEKADLILVMGTSLQVQPFCILPNFAKKGATRALINTPIRRFSRHATDKSQPVKLCGRRVSTKNWWNTMDGLSKWNEFLYEGDCDEFATNIVKHPVQATNCT